jgi:hypothetical protein
VPRTCKKQKLTTRPFRVVVVRGKRDVDAVDVVCHVDVTVYSSIVTYYYCMPW